MQRYNDGAHVPHTVRRVSRFQPVGKSAEVQVSGIKVRTLNYQSTMSLVVIEFIYLEGKGGELVVKELAAVDSHSKSLIVWV